MLFRSCVRSCFWYAYWLLVLMLVSAGCFDIAPAVQHVMSTHSIKAVLSVPRMDLRSPHFRDAAHAQALSTPSLSGPMGGFSSSDERELHFTFTGFTRSHCKLQFSVLPCAGSGHRSTRCFTAWCPSSHLLFAHYAYTSCCTSPAALSTMTDCSQM